jgi:Fis family transcriptional regulator, factor for inversion stimulation protein
MDATRGGVKARGRTRAGDRGDRANNNDGQSRQSMAITSGVKTKSSGVKINGNPGGKANGRSHSAKADGDIRAGSFRSSGPALRNRELPLRGHTERALNEYFASLNGHRPARLYDMVLHEVEEPLFRAVLDYAAGNQSRAAVILGINRGTLRKKLRALGLSE